MPLQCDLLVVGAGVAGVPAAVAAARCGLGTLLVERRAFPGGAGVAAGHREICGLYAQAEEPILLQRGGLVEEICLALAKAPPAQAARRKGRVHVLPYAPDRLKSVYGGLIAAEDRLESRFGCTVTSVEREGRTIRLVSCEEAGEVRTIEPRVVIDGSGGGVVLKLAGTGFREEAPEQRQLAGYLFRLEGVDGGDEMLPYSVPFCLNGEVRKGGLPVYLKFTTYAAGASGKDGFCRLNVPPFPREGRRRRAEAEARLVHRILSREIPSLKGSRIAGGGACVCDREGRRLIGRYTLTGEDIVGGRDFPGEAVRNAWPIEFWHQEKGPIYRYLEEGKEHYGIPAACLQSAEIDNLLAAGRCLSATPMALASTRVMGACMALGEAAGREAARLVQSGRVS